MQSGRNYYILISGLQEKLGLPESLQAPPWNQDVSVICLHMPYYSTAKSLEFQRQSEPVLYSLRTILCSARVTFLDFLKVTLKFTVWQ